jgi:serine/threonine protein kinase
LTSNDSEGTDFKQEVTAWAKSAGVTCHPHIIRLLATWHRNQSWYLLFPWAKGNLRDYWVKNDRPQHGHEQARWIGQQCLGLASALRQIHRAASNDDDQKIDSYGIHGDIKPENILWFQDERSEHASLVICDFGFTRFHSRRSRSAATAQGISPTYRAPEYDVNERQRGISRLYDIWALGCVYLEFITWYLIGPEAVRGTFTDKRISQDRGEVMRTDKFFICVPPEGPDSFGAMVKPCVHKVTRPFTLRHHHGTSC